MSAICCGVFREMTQSSNAFRVGLVLLTAMVIAGYFFVSSRKNTLTNLNSVGYYAYLMDASGINAKSLITVAGLQVGEISEVRLIEARVAVRGFVRVGPGHRQER